MSCRWLLTERPVEQICQPDTRPLQAVPHKGHVQLKVRGITLDDLLVLARGERLPSVVIDTLHSSSCAMAHREGERERRPLSHLAVHPDPTPVQLDELPGQGQPEPRALDLLVCRAH